MSFFFFQQKTAYEMRISDWSSDVCSSDLLLRPLVTREFDAFDETATERFQRLSYDLDGRTTFASYLGTTDALSTGFWTDYDALGRVIARSQDSEKGLLTTLSSYRSEEHTSELQSLMRISYAVFCLKKKKKQ